MRSSCRIEAGPVYATSRRAGPPLGADEPVAPSLAGESLPCGLLLGSVGDGGYVITPRRALAAGLAASALVELGFRGRVDADAQRLIVTDPAPTGDAVIDPVLESLASRRRAPDVDRCLSDLSLDWTILDRAARALEARALIHIERRPLHPLLMHRFHPVPGARPPELRRRLWAILEGARPAATYRDTALAALAEATGLAPATRGPSGHARGAVDTASLLQGRSRAGDVLSVVHPALVAATAGAERPKAPA